MGLLTANSCSYMRSFRFGLEARAVATFSTVLPAGSSTVGITRAFCASVAVVAHLSADGESSFAGPNLGRDEGAPFLHVHGMGFHQPDMPLDPRAFVEPAVA